MIQRFLLVLDETPSKFKCLQNCTHSFVQLFLYFSVGFFFSDLKRKKNPVRAHYSARRQLPGLQLTVFSLFKKAFLRNLMQLLKKARKLSVRCLPQKPGYRGFCAWIS